jgi:hypothetical protein
VFGLFPVGITQAQNLTPVLSSDSAIATAGYFRLSWETDATWVELQEAQESTFQIPHSLYAGPDQATLISGKPDGTWYYRVRGVNATKQGPWSEPVTVTVHHHSLVQALLFFALGLTVFVATLAMIIQGTRATKQ